MTPDKKNARAAKLEQVSFDTDPIPTLIRPLKQPGDGIHRIKRLIELPRSEGGLSSVWVEIELGPPPPGFEVTFGEPSQEAPPELETAEFGPLAEGEAVVQCSQDPSAIIERLQKLVGPRAVLIPIAKGTKFPVEKGWQNITYEDTQTEAYQARLHEAVLRGGNICVRLGRLSENLCAIDIDRAELLERLPDANPFLVNTPTIQGRPGRAQFFLKMAPGSVYPNSKGYYTLKLDGEEVGEWRCGGGDKGAESVIYGRHPDGMDYRILVEAPAVELDNFAEIDWLGIEIEDQAKTERPRSADAGWQGPTHLDKRIRAYLDKIDPAIQGEWGSDPTFWAACQLWNGFALDRDQALHYLRYYNDTRCRPPWSEKELEHKVDDAIKAPHVKPRGHLLTEQREARQGAQQQAGAGEREAQQEKDARFFDELLKKYRAALLTSEELETAPITPRLKLVGDWFKESDLGFIFGIRGSGKSWFVGGLASHLSTGKDFDTWPIPRAHPVLYLDGEMPQEDMRDRLRGMAPQNKNLSVLHHERLFELSLLSMNLADPATQKTITALCIEKGIKVLILDNLSCLVSGVDENASVDWEQLLPWLLDLRRRRIAVLIVAHAGATGLRMRGTTKREDPAAWVIKITEVEGRDQSEEGAKFEMKFTKIRNTPKPEWIRIWHFKTESNGEVSIGCEEISLEGKILQLIQAGLETATEIANEVGCAPSTVSKFAKRLEAKKLIEIKRRRYYPRGFANEKEP